MPRGCAWINCGPTSPLPPQLNHQSWLSPGAIVPEPDVHAIVFPSSAPAAPPLEASGVCAIVLHDCVIREVSAAIETFRDQSGSKLTGLIERLRLNELWTHVAGSAPGEPPILALAGADGTEAGYPERARAV